MSDSLDEARELKKSRRYYRTVYDNTEGRVVLADTLTRLGFFTPNADDPPETREAKTLLHKLGIFHDHNIDRVVEALIACSNDRDIVPLGEDAEEGDRG